NDGLRFGPADADDAAGRVSGWRGERRNRVVGVECGRHVPCARAGKPMLRRALLSSVAGGAAGAKVPFSASLGDGPPTPPPPPPSPLLSSESSDLRRPCKGSGGGGAVVPPFNLGSSFRSPSPHRLEAMKYTHSPDGTL